MDKERLERILKEVARGTLEVSEALELLKNWPFQDMGFACLDTHRSLRDNFPEVIYCPGKLTEEIVSIVEAFCREGENVIATKASPNVYEAVQARVPQAHYHKRARLITVVNKKTEPKGLVAVVTAGTADIPVAEEAAVSLEVMGVKVKRVFDVGVAGIHRLLERLPELNEAGVIIVVAGMEGALASVVAGLTAKPVIAVPTSVGYGASLGGLAALLGMLNTCAPGVGVVNIDNGYGAAALALAIININN